MTILVGTASWTDPTLIKCGRFYPKGCNTAEGRLRYYASRFDLVEVDSSYYAMPTADRSALWVERTPGHFKLNIKAFRLLTGHHTDPKVLGADLAAALPPSTKKNVYYKDVPSEIRVEVWRRFHAAIEPLDAAGKLGAVHFQFPPWLLRNRAGQDHVRHCVEMMDGRPVSVEFRNRTWFEADHMAETLALERELGVTHTVVDAPQGFSNSLPQVWEFTNERLALVRLHGRNAETWDIKGATAASDRFNYDYPAGELAELAERISRLAAHVDQLHVVFNNNFEDQGQRNAAALRSLFGQAPYGLTSAETGALFDGN